MRFETYHHQKTEEDIIAYWKKNKIIEKLREKNKSGKKFYFLDGPPYTSGKFHLAHAWNYALKDMVLRYQRSKGRNVWDRNGFDMHGLPTAHKVMAKHKLETKEDIESFGLDKFINECIKFSTDMAKIMTEDLVRIGTTFDLSNPYMPIKSEFMEGEWQLIKTAYEKDRLYYGEKVLTWCQNCETALAKHECEYETVTDKSIFVKFKLNSKKGTNSKEDCQNNEHVIVWTTTPWTIPYNLGVMVNPKLDYLKVKVWDESKEGKKSNEEIWYLSKALAGIVCGAVANKKMKVLEEFKGDHMEGWGYTHPFNNFISKYAELKKDHPNVHTVILNEQYVDTTAGSGLVHTAPGCGPEDQEACKPYNIPPFNNLQENGYFPVSMGKFSGLRAKVDDPKFTEALKDEGALIEITDVEHEYPHCWRCHKPVVFRITYQWFFKIEDIKQKIIEENSEVLWVPETALNSYESWVGNLKDNSISRQRFWGTPLPIWKCGNKDCKEIKVIGSREDIKSNGAKVPENLHIPWIDDVKFDCPKCKSKKSMLRVPDIIDVWVDAGTASWNCLDNDPKLIEEWFPADAILEAKEQTRLWFSMLSICSYLRFDKKSFKNVYVYGMLNDIAGKKMSKSIGNIISPYELIDKHGVDVLRYYMCQNNAGQDINFSWDECKTKARQVQILWNLHKLLINLSKENELNPFKLDEKLMNNLMSLEEKYIVSKLNSTLKTVDKLFETYELDSTIQPLEELYLELSRTYVQLVREKSSIGSKEDKELCAYTIAKVLLDFLKVFSIISPFITEAIYLNIKEEFGLKEESLSHFSFPKFDENKIDLELEQNIEGFKRLSQAALNAREKARLGVRWPIKELVVVSKKDNMIKSAEMLRNLLKKHINAKEISVLESLPGVKVSVKPEASMIGKSFGAKSPNIMKVVNSTSAEDIVNSLGKDGYFNIEIEIESKKEEIRLTQDMLVVEREVPELYIESETKGALVYLNTERSEELEAEGFAREVMRKVQTLRKNAGLEKTDSIILHLKCSEAMKKSLDPFEKDISEKVGAEKLVIAFTDAAKKHGFKEDFKVKKEEFTASFDKV
ncbi:isoleucine--tRNA ligase [archaeon]|jgi:isoleucyl-tRNA synthetase|nr:isoleucine--tRNA ligase [archaeon]MBT3450695.1 isoleucine--tRNA ligase [archaeon]MBT6869760.1 isoleucine--tRNA ligase [archaeon]MBT7192715.1 isoleucine--tRNA ligase [archaeon]MBT7380740.1 isoleucine--tRNA ligase [archaeon]